MSNLKSNERKVLVNVIFQKELIIETETNNPSDYDIQKGIRFLVGEMKFNGCKYTALQWEALDD